MKVWVEIENFTVNYKDKDILVGIIYLINVQLDKKAQKVSVLEEMILIRPVGNREGILVIDNAVEINFLVRGKIYGQVMLVYDQDDQEDHKVHFRVKISIDKEVKINYLEVGMYSYLDVDDF